MKQKKTKQNNDNKQQQNNKGHKHRICGVLRKTRNPSLPGRKVARKGFLEMMTPETSLKGRVAVSQMERRENIIGKWAI